MMRRALSLVLLAFTANADDSVWSTEDQMKVAAQIGSAITGSTLCNLLVDRSALAAVVKARIAPAGKLTPEMASELLFYAAAMQGMQPTLLGSRPTKAKVAEACRTYLGAFGPNGLELPGVLRP